MKRAYIVHGWDGSPDEAWMPWLKHKLEDRGFVVTAPAMPNAETPEIDAWVSHLRTVVGEGDEDMVLVGHSIGCQTILRYLEDSSKVAGIVCVAGWFHLPHLQTDEEKMIAKPWLETPMNFELIKTHAGKIVAIFSDDDPHVDLSEKELFEQNLNASTIVEHGRGHFSGHDGIKELPSALEAVLEIAQSE